MVYIKKILVRKKGDKDYSKRGKQMMGSLINDYSLFSASDDEMIKMLSVKLGKETNEKKSETIFYRLKKEAIRRRGQSEQWLDQFSKFQIIEHYRKRIDESELVQKKLLKTFVDETDRSDEKQNKILINHLAKTISENSKVLAEFDMAPPILAKIKSMIPVDISTINNNGKKELINNDEDKATESNPYVRLNIEYPESAIFPPIDNTDNYHKEFRNKKENLIDDYDPNGVF